MANRFKMSLPVHDTSIPRCSNCKVCGFRGNHLMLSNVSFLWLRGETRSHISWSGRDVPPPQPTFALGQVAVEAQRAYKLEEEDGDGRDDEQHHKHHHPN